MGRVNFTTTGFAGGRAPKISFINSTAFRVTVQPANAVNVKCAVYNRSRDHLEINGSSVYNDAIEGENGVVKVGTILELPTTTTTTTQSLTSTTTTTTTQASTSTTTHA